MHKHLLILSLALPCFQLTAMKNEVPDPEDYPYLTPSTEDNLAALTMSSQSTASQDSPTSLTTSRKYRSSRRSTSSDAPPSPSTSATTTSETSRPTGVHTSSTTPLSTSVANTYSPSSLLSSSHLSTSVPTPSSIISFDSRPLSPISVLELSGHQIQPTPLDIARDFFESFHLVSIPSSKLFTSASPRGALSGPPYHDLQRLLFGWDERQKCFSIKSEWAITPCPDIHSSPTRSEVELQTPRDMTFEYYTVVIQGSSKPHIPSNVSRKVRGADDLDEGKTYKREHPFVWTPRASKKSTTHFSVAISFHNERGRDPATGL